MKTSIRKAKGQAVVVMGFIIGLIFLLSIGLYAFELNRLEVAREQLQAACEAAALAGAATLAGSDVKDPYTAQSNAQATALHEFQQNSVAGTSLAAATQAVSNSSNPAVGGSSLYIEFLDPHNNNQVVTMGDPAGKIVKAYGALGFQPAFGKFLGIGNVPLRGVASGGVPQLDLIMCFDVSASMDDQTPVTFVRRTWDPAKSKVTYTKTSCAGGAPAGATAEGPMYQVIGPPPTGSACDALPPQNLSVANQSDHNYRLQFNGALRGANDNSYPGNKSGNVAWTNTSFTDLVVNVDGNNIFGGFTYKGYSFPDVGTLVEASRGNLDNAAVFASSGASTGVPATVKPMAGYKAAYQEVARNNILPLHEAQVACQDFFTIMNNNTDGHFSVVDFTSNAGKTATDGLTMDNVDGSYAAGGTNKFQDHLIALDSTQSNYNTVLSDISTTTAVSGTNIGDAVNTGVNELKGAASRKGAKKFIIVFTDGQPTAGGPLNADPWANARQAAVNAKNAGIPIYTIGLAQVPTIIPGETAILNDTNNSPTAGGIAAIAGNGGKFWLVTSNANLRLTFENLARQLVQLVK